MLITIVSVSLPAIRQCGHYFQQYLERSDLNVRMYDATKESLDLTTLETDVRAADVLITDLMGAPQSVYRTTVSAMKGCGGIRLTFGGMAPNLGRLGGYDAARFRMCEEDEENLHRMNECWKRAFPEDIEYIFGLVLGTYMGLDWVRQVEPPFVREGVYLMDPLTLEEYESLEDYSEAHGFGGRLGTVLLTYSGSNYPTSNLEGVRMLFRKLDEFSDVIPVAMNSYNVGYADALRGIAGRPDVIVNLLPFRFLAGPMGGDSVSATDLLRDLDAAFMSPFFMAHKSREDWESSRSGTDPMEFMLDIFLPELDGAVCTLPVGFEETSERLDGFDITVRETVPLEDRVDRIVGKVRGYLALRHKPNREKRVALLAYNYPPGEGNMFGGSFLDGAGSIAAITRTLHEAGYDVDPMTGDEVLGRFLSNGLVNEPDWVQPSGELILSEPHGDHPDAVCRRWGREPGDVMVRDGRYMIPGILDGNLFIGLQPPRVSSSDDAVATYHDQDIPPHHQYMAVYEWVRDAFHADAVIHLGTHGTLEFLPGKESAMSSSCYPDSLIGDTTHTYLYYSGNPSEAMIAKRRSHAQIVSYMPPPFVKSGTYGDLADLESLVSEYREASKVDEGRAQVVLGNMTRKAETMRLPTDPEELEDELVSIRESLIPNGLHVFGQPLSTDEAIDYAVSACRFPHDGVPSTEEALGEVDDDRLSDILRTYIATGHVPEGCPDEDSAVSLLDYCVDLMSRVTVSREPEGLLRALEGRFLDVRPGGDSLKDPDSLPSGFNIIQFNPNNIPSMSAFERGVQAAEGLVESYRQRTGSLPRRATMVLWGLETSRTQGMTIGQLCGYLGIRMTGTSGSFVSRFEVIPLEELGRPRIDVTVSMCGFFRDMFPNLVEGINGLFGMISALDESDAMNPYLANTRANRTFLESKGVPEEELDELAGCRLFGPREGEYGTSVTGRVGSSGWKEESELGDAFIDSLRYAYTGKRRAVLSEGLLERNYADVDMVSQVRDSKDREIIDLDHYYEFLGGLSKAVENVNGRKAAVFVVDGSGPTVRVQDIRRSIEHGVRTRLLNPRWIDGLLDVKYHGAQNINDRFENVLGLAATVGEVDSGVFSDMMSCYVTDREMRARLRENNNWAYMSMMDRLFEANSRGYWHATEDELDTLREAYEESESQAEAESDRR